jgi:hypothetical protein
VSQLVSLLLADGKQTFFFLSFGFGKLYLLVGQGELLV